MEQKKLCKVWKSQLQVSLGVTLVFPYLWALQQLESTAETVMIGTRRCPEDGPLQMNESPTSEA